MQLLALLIGLLLSCSVFAGSPFYLTAGRSFSTDETPVIRLDYTDEQPMLLRVLKPEPLDSFLDGQFNISRSYEQPISELNPGYYFAKGINGTESPLRLMRGLLASDFRKSLTGSTFSHALKNTGTTALASVPEQVLIAAPKGFKIVNEEFLDLTRNGTNAQDLSWWFDQDYYLRSRYKIRDIQLDKLPDGIYLVQAVQGKNEAQCLLQVSSLSVQVKQSGQQVLVRAIERGLTPVANATVSYRDGRGKWQVLADKTDAGGELLFNNPEGLLDGKLLVKVDATLNNQTRTALTATDFLPSQDYERSVFVMTDRPIFKPGETFFYKGIIRKAQEGQLQIPAIKNKQSKVSLLQADGRATGLTATAEVTDFATFSGSFALDNAQTPGLYRLLAEIDDKAYGGEFRVRDYQKPTFYLTELTHDSVITPGQAFKLKFYAKRYSGGIPQDVKFEVFLYRKKFEAPQFVEEAGLGLASGPDYFGQIKSTNALSQPRRVFSSIEERQATELSNPWENAARLDDNGEGSFEFTVPMGTGEQSQQEWVYTLMVKAQDAAGSAAVLTENMYQTLSEAQPALRFNKTIAALGEKDLALLVQSNFADGKPAPYASGVIDVELTQPNTGKQALVKLTFKTDANGQQQLALPALSSYGRLTAIAKLEMLGEHTLKHPANSLPASLIVAGNNGEAVTDATELELYTSHTVLSPGEQANIFALLPKAWGQQEQGYVWQTTTGSRIFSNQNQILKGRSHWFNVTAKPEYGTGFYHTVTLPMPGGKYREQTLGFRVVPWDKRLKLTIQPEQAEAEPLKTTRLNVLVQRSDGTPAANTELAVGIVDKAVYAVQTEFRPNVFDYFYPLQRNNLATFYSDELQGYGYADLLRKPNFSLSALKSQSKLAKKAMRDTAGWFPHLVTDAQGKVSITVDMPANITEWLVTAVANDKQGRLGEATGQFRTTTDVTLEMLGPPFMYIGDTADFVIRVNNQLNKPVALSGEITLPDRLSNLSGEVTPKAVVPANKEQRWPLRLAASGVDDGLAAIKIGLTAPNGVRVGGAESFDIPIKKPLLTQSYRYQLKDSGLFADYPASASPQRLIVQVESGLLGAALNAATMLVQYPYGCTEQLAHSIVPNLVLLDVLARAEIKPEQLGPLTEILTKAKQNAALGIQKLRANQKADGGFSLWPNDSEASVPVTLIAMQALHYANELNVEGAAKLYNKGIEWLSNQTQAVDATDTFSLARYPLFSTWSQPWQQQADFVNKVVAEQTADTSELIAALNIVLSYKSMSYHSFNKQFANIETVEQSLITRLQLSLTELKPETYQAQYKPELGFTLGLPGVISAGLGALDNAKALPDELKARLVKYLLQQRENRYWRSTYDTAQVIYNTRQLLSQEAALAHSAKPRIINVSTGNKTVLGKLAAIPGGYLAEFTGLTPAQDLSQLIVSGTLATDTVTANLNVGVPYTTVEAKSSGVSVTRSYRRVTASGSEVIDLQQQAFHVGDVIVSEVSVKRSNETNNNAHAASDFVVISDAIPAIAEGLENDKTYLADAKIQSKSDDYWRQVKETQRYPDKIVRVAKLLSPSEMKFYQVFRIARAGRAVLAPATVFDMYQETEQANSVAQVINVD